MKILLINPSSLSPEAAREYMLGIPYLSGALKHAGYTDIKILNLFNTHWAESKDVTRKLLESYLPDVVLISCFTINRVAGMKTAVMAKEINSNVKIAMGGMHPTFLYEQILTNYPVDVVCIGEGDETVVELARSFDGKIDISEVKGIAYKSIDGQVVKTDPRCFIKDLDALPMADHAMFEDYLIKTKQAYLVSSRGCPFGCQFCSTTEFWGRKWRNRSAENVVDEIEDLVKTYGVEYIFFLDDEFTLNKNSTIRLCKLLLRRSINIKWGCSTRVDTIDEELIEWMVKAGCTNIGFGIESGSPEILKSTGKKITCEGIIRAFKLSKEYGVKAGGFLMVGNPGETNETVKDTIKLLKNMKTDIPSVAVAEIYPGTQLYDIAKTQGFISDDYWLSEAPPPLYTVEHSVEQLKFWSFKIIFSQKLQKGLLVTVIYLFHYITSKFTKIIGFFLNTFKKKTGLTKSKYDYKEY